MIVYQQGIHGYQAYGHEIPHVKLVETLCPEGQKCSVRALCRLFREAYKSYNGGNAPSWWMKDAVRNYFSTKEMPLPVIHLYCKRNKLPLTN